MRDRLALLFGLATVVVEFLPGVPYRISQPIGFAGQIVIIAFYWWHCAGPALVHIGARRTVLRVVPAVGIASLIASGAVAYLNITTGDVPAWMILGMGITSFWYLAAWPLPAVIARISGGIDQIEALRRLVWGLNYTLSATGRTAEKDTWRTRARRLRDRLATFSRTPATSEFIDLWVTVADAKLADPDTLTDPERLIAMAEIARRLWPTSDSWHVAVPWSSV